MTVLYSLCSNLCLSFLFSYLFQKARSTQTLENEKKSPTTAKNQIFVSHGFRFIFIESRLCFSFSDNREISCSFRDSFLKGEYFYILFFPTPLDLEIKCQTNSGFPKTRSSLNLTFKTTLTYKPSLCCKLTNHICKRSKQLKNEIINNKFTFKNREREKKRSYFF